MPAPLISTTGKTHERGYALLLIFLMAAVVALSMFAVLPRVAFEAQRDQEQLLVDRGEQYKRAIQLYYRKLKKYPVKMEDLENTNNVRFLRDRYVDPLTGKSEWRLIHVGPGGVFTDSLTQKPNANTKQAASSVNNFIGELKGLGDNSTTVENDGVNVGLRRRASDPGGADVPNDPNAPPPDPNAPAGVPGINVPVQTQASNGGAGLGSSGLGSGGLGSNNNGSNNNGSSTNGSSNNSGQSASNGADLIRNLLTSPRPGGAPPGVFGSDSSGSGTDNSSQSSGFNSSNATNVSGNNGIQGSSTPGQAIGSSAGTFATGSFAGIASTVKRPGIKIYADHKKYNEWEFIYDYGKDPAFGGGATMPIPSNPNNANGLNGNNGINGNPNGTNAFGSNNSNTGSTNGLGGTSTNGVSGTTINTPTPSTGSINSTPN